jgi:hypothetical protein
MPAVTAEPFLHVDEPSSGTRAVALVLHGGRSRSVAPVRANQLSVLRMLPFVSSLRRAGSRHGLSVARLRYRVRGWNGPAQSPVADVEWALARLVARFPNVPVGLVGHSMGGRAALYAAGADPVLSVVGLAPWCEPGDPVDQLAGRRLLIAHGAADRMTSPPESAAYARRAAKVAVSVGYVSVQGEKHAMLHRAGVWHQLASGFTLAVLCEVPPAQSVGAVAANVVTESLAGATTTI